MNRIARKLAQIPESRCGLPLVFMFSAILMGALYWVRLGADLNFDGEIYISAASKYAVGMYNEGLAIYPMPLYPYLISLMHRIIPDWVSAGRLISYFSMTLAVIPLYRLSTDLFNRQAAFWGCLAFTLLPETLLYSNSVLRESSFCLFFMWAVYFAQKAIQSKALIHLFGSALFGFFSTLFRIEGLIIFPVYFCILIALAVSKRNQFKDYCRMVATWGCLFLFLFVAIQIGMQSGGTIINRYNDWTIYSHTLRDTSFLENYRHLYEQFQQMQEAAWNNGIGQHFVETARILMPLIYLLGMLQVFFSVILAVNIIPLLWGLKQAFYTERHVFVLISACCLSTLACGFFVQQNIILKRYLFMPAVLLCPWVGFGMDRILAFAQRRSHTQAIVVCVLLLFFTMPALEFDKYFKHRDNLKSIAGSWIARQEGLKSLKIAFNDQVVQFYTDMEIDIHGEKNTMLQIGTNDMNFSNFARFARENNVDLIVISSRADRRKNITDFLGYKEIKEFNDKKNFIKLFILEERFNSLGVTLSSQPSG
jgi:hypothetical protein